MSADRNTTIRASQLRNLTITTEDIRPNSLSGNVLIDNTVSGSELTNNIILYNDILTTSGSYSGEVLIAVVDDAQTIFGDTLYQGADFHYERADAASSGTAPALAIAVENGSGSKRILLRGQVCNTGWNWSAGYIYLATISGGLTQSPSTNEGNQIQPLGWALSANTIFFTGHIGVGEI